MRTTWIVVAALWLMGLASTARAQEPPRITVRVRQVAGASFYLDVGTLHGLATGDTLFVYGEVNDTPLGRAVVTASTDRRSVFAFAGAPFAVAGGDRLTLLLLREPTEEAPPSETEARAAPAPRPAAQGPTPVPRQATVPSRGRAHGRVSLDLGGLRSVTRVGGADPVDVERSYATPALRVDVTAPGAVGGFTLHTAARVAYRYSGGSSIQPAASTRIYAASLERRFTSVPLQLILGRFHSPVETYSGYWDGALIRLGGGGFGAGALVGFEPDQWNEGVSTQRPKATAFVEGMARGPRWRWRGALSAHTVRPADSLPAHTFVGATQRLTAGPLLLRHDLQVDRHPLGGAWRVSRLQARAGLDLPGGAELRLGFSRRESYVLVRADDPFAPRRDRLDVGLGIRGGQGYVSADLDRSRDASGNETRGASLAFSRYSLPGLDRVGLWGALSRWSGAYGTTWSGAPGVSLDLSDATVRVGYRYGRSDYLGRVLTSQGLDAVLDVPLGSGMRVSGRGRIQWGGLMRSQALDLTLSRTF